jgi:hypothetical protein
MAILIIYLSLSLQANHSNTSGAAQ